MPSLSSHSKHEEFWSSSALQIKNQKKRISEKGKESKNSMNQLNSAWSNGTVANRMNSVENFATRYNFRYIAKNFVCSEILCFAVLCLNDSVLVFLLSTLIVILLFHIVL